MTLQPVQYHRFIASFTGELVTLQTPVGGIRFDRPYPRVVRHAPYMLEVDPNTSRCRILPVLMPDPRIGR